MLRRFCGLFRAQRGIPTPSFINFKENQSASKATDLQPTNTPKKLVPPVSRFNNKTHQHFASSVLFFTVHF
jgi:hypothetical protein